MLGDQFRGQQRLFNPGPAQPPPFRREPEKAPTGITSRGEQLPMFMSARDIVAKYQPTDGDRNDNPDLVGRMGEPTGRAVHTKSWSGLPDVISTRHWPNQPRASLTGIWGDQLKMPGTGREYERTSEPETDEQVWDRKYEEAKMAPDEYYKMRSHGLSPDQVYKTPGGGYEAGKVGRYEWRSGPGKYDDSDVSEHHSWVPFEQDTLPTNTSESLAEHVRRRGITEPIGLSTEQFGFSGKQSVTGGHHRLAVMNAEKPDVLNPVVFHLNTHEAQEQGKKGLWKYT